MRWLGAGSVRSRAPQHRTGSAELRASAADLAALRVAIAAQVAGSYADLRGWQQRLALARPNAANPAGHAAPGSAAAGTR